MDAFDSASKQVADRFCISLAEGFAEEFSRDPASGELRSWGEGLNRDLSVNYFYNLGRSLPGRFLI